LTITGLESDTSDGWVVIRKDSCELPPGYTEPDDPPVTGGTGVDEDGDMFHDGEDCDDTDPSIYPGAEDTIDGVDRDCDGYDGTFCAGDQTHDTAIGCEYIGGSLIIEDPAITATAALSGLTAIDGDLAIWLTEELTTLEGLESLTSVGGTLYIQNNSALSSVAALHGLTSIGDSIDLSGNTLLESCEGLEGISSIGGNLEVWWDGVAALNGLESLTSIGGNLIIKSNTALSTLEGLNTLTSIGREVSITHNSNLATLSGLDAVETIAEQITIQDNPSLTSITFSALTTSGTFRADRNAALDTLTVNALSTIDGSFVMSHHPGLTDISGFNALISVSEFFAIRYDDTITALSGLGSLETIGAGFTVYLSAVTNLDGLGSLETVGGDFNIDKSEEFYSIAGLHSLTSVGGSVSIHETELSSLHGLESLEWIGGDFSLGSNHALTTLDAIGSAGVLTSMGDTRIQYNSLLCTSSVEAFIDRLFGFGWTGVSYNRENGDC
jgi:hypothetical protein